MIAPLAPHFAEECWEMIGKTVSLFESPVWFAVDKAALIEDTVNIAVQISGKLRGTLSVPLDSDQEMVKAEALTLDSVKKHLEGKTIIKEIFVKNKILNIVAK
jgi:leucyl-tRNA synthetase